MAHSQQLPTIADFFEDYTRKVFLNDGTSPYVKFRQWYSGSPVYWKDDPDHPEDWRWVYPQKGEPLIVDGPENALSGQCLHSVYVKAKRKNEKTGQA